MRLGIFGGSFDPVHFGHLKLAQCCLEQAELDEVWFTPAARQPFKRTGPHAPGDDRCRMIELAIAGHAGLRLCRQEIDRGGVSYTVDTLRSIHADRPDARLFFLMGADSLRELPNWYQSAEICRLATPLVVQRAGEPAGDLDILRPLLPQERRLDLGGCRIEMPAVTISSSDIRRRVAAGESIAELAPQAVLAYIGDRNLYRAAATPLAGRTWQSFVW